MVIALENICNYHSVAQEWPHASYPPWAHGPGYIISRDIAKFIVRGHHERDLKVKFSCLEEGNHSLNSFSPGPALVCVTSAW